MAKKAIIYARWSSHEQTDGTTLERQIRNCSQFAKNKGFTDLEIVTDEGISAYTGANIRTGNLSKVIKDFVYARRIATDSVLIVEQLDRLTRADASTAFAWINNALSLGLKIMVEGTGKTLDKNLLNDDVGALMSLILENFNSNFESKKKAKRIASYWEIAREKGSIDVNLRHPSWLEAVDGELVAKAGAQETIAQIFDYALNGSGSTAIAKSLNELAVKPFAGTKNAARHWTAARVRRILYNDAVVGYYTPFNRPRSGGSQRAGPKIIRYPVIIDQATFEKVQIGKKAQSGGRSNTVTNLIPKISRCYKCGGAMGARGSSSKGHYYLYCQTAKNGSGMCNHSQGWRYADIEKPMLDHLLDRAISDDVFAEKDDSAAFVLAQKLSELNALIHQKTDHLKVLLNQMTGEHDDIVMGVYNSVSAELTKAKKERDTVQASLNHRQGKVSPERHIERVKSIRADLDHDDDAIRNKARVIARDALSQIIDRIDFDDSDDNVVFHLAGGIGTFIVLYGDGELLEHHQGKNFDSHPKRDAINRFLKK